MHQLNLSPRGERGQVLVIVAGGLLAFIAMVGLVIDGGHAWGRQRETQNAADSIAKAGTVQVQRHYAGEAVTDGDVGCAVENAATINGIAANNVESVYADYLGNALSPEIVVGACGAAGTIPANAQGVRSTASTDFDTFLMGIVGMQKMTATADATAIVGQATGLCPADAGCGALPITFPQTLRVCDSTEAEFSVVEEDGDGVWEPFELIPEGWTLDSSNLAVIPLCDTASGSVGFIDFGCGKNLADEIQNPCHDEIPIPDWLHTQSGNANNAEDELRAYTGDVAGTAPNEGVTVPEPEDRILAIPVHSNTCDKDPGAQAYCPPTPADENQWQGQGDNLYYYVDLWIGLKLDAAYTQGGDVECRAPNTQGRPVLVNPVPVGKVSCLKGWIVDFYTAPGSIQAVDLTPGDPVPLGISLVN